MVAIHRRHHRFTDAPGDPHSPHAPPREACAGATRSPPVSARLRARVRPLLLDDRPRQLRLPASVRRRPVPQHARAAAARAALRKGGPLWSRGAEEIVFRVATACLAHDPFESWHHPAALRALASDVCFLAFEVMDARKLGRQLGPPHERRGSRRRGARPLRRRAVARSLAGRRAHPPVAPRRAEAGDVAAAEQTDFCDHFTRAMERAGLVRRVRRRSTEEEVKKD